MGRDSLGVSIDTTPLPLADQSKVCSVCSVRKPLTDFYAHKGCRQGVRPSCKKCVIARPGKNSNLRAWRAANPEKALLSAAANRANMYGLPFDLTLADIVIPERCPVFGTPMGAIGGPRGPDTPSLDRIAPERGYVRGNVEVISWEANRLKNSATLEQLEALVDYLSRRVVPKQTRRIRRNPS